MKIGFSLSNNQGIEDVQDVLNLATKAESLGFDSVWASEHVFNVSYVYERIGDRPYYEPLTVLAYVAAETSGILLGTSVLVVPYHNPIRLAKVAATLDVLSKGRLVLGLGVGVIEQELETMGSAYADRGAITDESIKIMKELWTQPDPKFQGKYHSFSGMKFSPKPVQRPHIPLVIGGTSRAAIRRAVALGNGWHPTALPPDDLQKLISYLREQAQSAGRSPGEVPVSVSAPIGPRSNHFSLGESPGEILENAQAYERIGVERLVISANTRNAEEMLPAMEMVARDVMPAFA